MPRALIAVLLVALAGCGTSGTLDPAVVASLRVSVAATLDGMGVAVSARPSERALADQVNLLALQVDPARVADLRSGAYGVQRLRDDAADLDLWLEELRRKHALDQKPPAMLAHLRARDDLDGDARLLMHALIRQAQRETGWAPSAKR
ncbi:MAG TPA: hypothetical protein VEL07_22870 [Planctomycetota bacterium]|nr:hypothetical protein [Planctomycetota bacterium]